MKKKTKKQSQWDEEEEKLLAKEHRTKKRHESTAFAPERPLIVNLVMQKQKDLSETNDDIGRLVQVTIKKRKVVVDAPPFKKAKKDQPTAESRAFTLPLSIP